MSDVAAAVKVAAEQLEIQHFARPAIGPDAGLLRVESAGVGASDPAHFRRPKPVPVIMGHENVGVIEELGPIAAARWGLRAGDRIALHEYLPCWHCRWCLEGNFGLCVEGDMFTNAAPLRFGTSTSTIAPHLWGGFAQFLYLPPNAVIHRVPDGLSARVASLAIPFGNGFQWAVFDGGAGINTKVLIFGPSQQGLGCAFAAKIAGASLVILAGLSRDRARLAVGTRIGADATIDAETQNLRERVMELTGGSGVDVVVDTTGDETGSVVADAVAVAAKGAKLSLNGLGQSVPIGPMKRQNLTVRTPRSHSFRAVETALRYLSETTMPVAEVCSHDFGLTDVATAIYATGGKVIPDAIHVTVDPWK